MEEVEIAGLRCSDVLTHLSAYLDGELPPELKAKADAHLAGCPNCEQFGGQMQRLLQSLRAKPVPAPPAGLLERLQERLKQT